MGGRMAEQLKAMLWIRMTPKFILANVHDYSNINHDKLK